MKKSRRSILMLAGAGAFAGIAGAGYAMARSDANPPGDDLATPSASPEATPGATPLGHSPISIAIGDTVIRAELWDNASAHDLVSLLPLSLEFRDYGGQEKLAELPRSLTLAGAPSGSNALAGDIGYYAPAGVIVLYYEDVGYFSGIVRLGRMLDDVALIIDHTSDFVATIALDH